jgi:hypothetical protein
MRLLCARPVLSQLPALALLLLGGAGFASSGAVAMNARVYCSASLGSGRGHGRGRGRKRSSTAAMALSRCQASCSCAYAYARDATRSAWHTWLVNTIIGGDAQPFAPIRGFSYCTRGQDVRPAERFCSRRGGARKVDRFSACASPADCRGVSSHACVWPHICRLLTRDAELAR